MDRRCRVSKDLLWFFRLCKKPLSLEFKLREWSLLEKVTYLNQNIFGSRLPAALV